MGEFWGLDPAEWEALGTWATALVSLGLGLGALIVAAVQLTALRTQSKSAQQAAEAELEALRAQVEASRESTQLQLDAMERARRTGLAPLVVPTGLRFIQPTRGVDNHHVEIAVENIGNGPAINVSVRAWLLQGRPADTPEAAQEVRRAMETPPFRAAVLVLAAGGRESQLLAAAGQTTAVNVVGTEWFAALRLDFRDRYCENPILCSEPLVYPAHPGIPALLTRSWPKGV